MNALDVVIIATAIGAGIGGWRLGWFFRQADDGEADRTRRADNFKRHRAYIRRNAMVILESITEEVFAGYGDLYDYGYEDAGGEFFPELAEAWTEAVLSADPSTGSPRSAARTSSRP